MTPRTRQVFLKKSALCGTSISIGSSSRDFIHLLIYLLLSCSIAESQKTGQAGESINLGIAFSITGGASRYGEPEKNAALMLTRQINDSGGINGRKIDLWIYNDQGKPDMMENFSIKRLIGQHNVVAIIGGSISECAYEAALLCEDAGVPFVSCAPSEKQLCVENNTSRVLQKYVFKTPYSYTHSVKKIFQDCKKKGYKKIAIITSMTPFGAAGRAELLKQAREYEITIIRDELYLPESLDITPQLMDTYSKKPNAIIHWSDTAVQELIAGQMKQFNMNIQLYQDPGFGMKEYLTENNEGVLFPSSPLLVGNDIDRSNIQYEVITNFKKDYETRYGGDVPVFAGYAYDAYRMVIQAIKTHGAERDEIRNGLESIEKFIGTTGIYTMSPEDHCGLSEESLVLVTVRDCEFRLDDTVQ